MAPTTTTEQHQYHVEQRPYGYENLTNEPYTIDVEPDVILQGPLPGSRIALFGCIHADPEDSRTGDFILRHKPCKVVVETALNDVHGAATGNIACMEDYLRVTPSNGGFVDGRTLAISRLGAQLSGTVDPVASSVWKEVVASQLFYSEHLAYIAAFAVGADLVFGDRPKGITYKRMLHCPSLEDLDAAFALQSAANYHDLVAHMQVPKDLYSPSLTERILIQERDAVMLQSMHDASVAAGDNSLVVGVVGSSHLGGMQQLWKGDAWRDVIENEKVLDVPVGATTSSEGETPAKSGVRRALFDGVIRLTCRADVSTDISETLDPPTGEALEAYLMTSEIYGSSRMLLATLNEDQLAEVCGGWRCDMWEVLQPLRSVRPVNGGKGYDQELVVQLRMLNFELQM